MSAPLILDIAHKILASRYDSTIDFITPTSADCASCTSAPANIATSPLLPSTRGCGVLRVLMIVSFEDVYRTKYTSCMKYEEAERVWSPPPVNVLRRVSEVGHPPSSRNIFMISVGFGHASTTLASGETYVLSTLVGIYV